MYPRDRNPPSVQSGRADPVPRTDDSVQVSVLPTRGGCARVMPRSGGRERIVPINGVRWGILPTSDGRESIVPMIGEHAHTVPRRGGHAGNISRSSKRSCIVSRSGGRARNDTETWETWSARASLERPPSSSGIVHGVQDAMYGP